MTLYKITTTGLGDYYTVAEHPTEASDKLKGFLDKADYGFPAYREIQNIEIVAVAANDARFIAEKRLVL